ncbi:ATP-dependent Clp protease proteolytic subunit 4, chloroplastic [Linum grandiflorum]
MKLLSVSSPSALIPQKSHHKPRTLPKLFSSSFSFPTNFSSSPSLKTSATAAAAVKPTNFSEALFFPSSDPDPEYFDPDAEEMLLNERILFIGKEINDVIADALVSRLLLLDAQDPTKDIRLMINSHGGSLSAVMAIYDIMQLVRADVTTIAVGMAGSTAALILGGGTRGKRFAMPNARVMIHQPQGGIGGRVADVEVQVNEIVQNKKDVMRIISSCSGRTIEQVEDDIRWDKYMSPIEAVEYGLIDGIIDRDTVVPLAPVPEYIPGTLYDEMVTKGGKEFVTPNVPDDEIY